MSGQFGGVKTLDVRSSYLNSLIWDVSITWSKDENGQNKKKLKFGKSRHHYACKIKKI
jgi:hypothetical protein